VAPDVLGRRKQVCLGVVNRRGMRGPGLPAERLVAGQLMDAALSGFDPDPGSVLQRPDGLPEILDELFAADAAAGLADEPAPVKQRIDLPAPVRTQRHGHHIGVASVTESDFGNIVCGVDDPFT
jgi:hypothetical protein